jgi:hypothetical protein
VLDGGKYCRERIRPALLMPTAILLPRRAYGVDPATVRQRVKDRIDHENDFCGQGGSHDTHPVR